MVHVLLLYLLFSTIPVNNTTPFDRFTTNSVPYDVLGSTPPSDSTTLSDGALVGLVVGTCILFVFIVLVIWLYRRRRRSSAKRKYDISEEMEPLQTSNKSNQILKCGRSRANKMKDSSAEENYYNVKVIRFLIIALLYFL